MDRFNYYINNNVILAIVACSLVVVYAAYKRKTKSQPRFRVHPYLQSRNARGRFTTDIPDLINHETFFNDSFHMSLEHFRELFQLVEPYLVPKRNTRPNDYICPMQKLCIVLEFFVSGSLQKQLASSYRLSKQHLGTIIDCVCDAIIGAMMTTEIAALTKAGFIQIANEFNHKWNLPNCLGAIDGKHVAIIAPHNSGSLCYNYKGHHSLVLLAICDANYKFTYLDVGAFGSEGDANIFRKSAFGQCVVNDKLDFPENAAVAGEKIPFFFVADDAFPLCKRIMKPYSKRKLTDEERIFNYRLSRARRCIENAFGILSTKWRCVQRTLFCGPNRAQKIITACCLLHNFLLNRKDAIYCPESYCDSVNEEGILAEGQWRQNHGLENEYFSEDDCSYRGRPSEYGKYIRERLKNYVNSALGSIPWQRRSAGIV